MPLYRSPLTVTLWPSSFSKKYGPMIPPALEAHQTVSFCGCNGVSTYTCGLASLQMRQCEPNSILIVHLWPSLQLADYAKIARGLFYTFDLEIPKYRSIPKGLIRTDFIQQVEKKVSSIVSSVSARTLSRLSVVPANTEGVKHRALPTICGYCYSTALGIE
ncbi:hypothetical protein TNCV_2472921 [Trichonephila clavipes]|nr:hypothetical protein TNCV_2472921 [Trichonephila clavipes]